MLKKKLLTPWDLAMASLVSLQTSKLLNELEAKAFYSHVTDILKNYIFGRYGYNIYGKTDREILAYLDEQVSFPHELLPLLAEILDHASAIKFANVPGLIGQMDSDLSKCVRIVHETIPVAK